MHFQVSRWKCQSLQDFLWNKYWSLWCSLRSKVSMPLSYRCFVARLTTSGCPLECQTTMESQPFVHIIELRILEFFAGRSEYSFVQKFLAQVYLCVIKILHLRLCENSSVVDKQLKRIAEDFSKLYLDKLWSPYLCRMWDQSSTAIRKSSLGLEPNRVICM